ncbi:MAG: hypothetical protein ACI4I1_05070 [Oscillospiraceae bacterium]
MNNTFKTKIKSVLAGFISSVMVCTASAVPVSAANLEDVSIPLNVGCTLGPWENYKVGLEHYDTSKITPESTVIVTYSQKALDETDERYNTDGDSTPYLCTIAVQVYEDLDNGISGVWERIVPNEYTSSKAVFTYGDIVALCPNGDISKLDALNICALKNSEITPMTITITKCKPGMYVEMTAEELAEHYKNMVIVILAAALGVIILMIIAFIIILKKKTSVKYDISTGQYIQK